jgi:L-fuculose-phosphate aldolase
VLPEVVYTIGGIPTTEYATPATPEGGKVIRELIRRCDALLMDRHGALTIGTDVIDALHKMEKIEHAAETLLTAHILGRVRKLDKDEVEKLYQVREAYGVTGRAFQCSECGCGETASLEPGMDESLDRAAAETLQILGRG